MSELTLCNFCSYEDLLARARERNAHLTLFVDPELQMIGVRASDREEPLAWFVELTDRCAC